MSRTAAALTAAFTFVLCLFANAQQPTVAPLPRLIRFTGVIASADNTPRTGVVGVMFSLYTDRQGGTALWTVTTSREKGHFYRAR
jgi:hypothetical protein